MNPVLIGNNLLNGRISAFFREKGLMPFVVEDAEELRELSGQVGSFKIRLKNNSVNAGFVVLTEPLSLPPAPIDGGIPRSLFSIGDTPPLPATGLTPVVFLLDYYCESPMAATIEALTGAKVLAEQKRRVYFLARSIRTAGHGAEMLYKQTRRAGVTFLKYETVQISYDDNTADFTIQADDGVYQTQLITPHIFADGGRKPGEKFRQVIKKLNLWPDKNGYLLEDRHFLSPVLTSRRGVYFISRDLGAERLQEGLAYILADAATSCRENAALPGKKSAVVNRENCVFCYSCFRACPHAAMQPDAEMRAMRCLTLACRGCGICASICPGSAITLNQEPPLLPASTKGNKLLVLCCENSAALAMEEVLPRLGKFAAQVELRSVPCGGRIGMELIAEALSRYKKVLVAVCMDGACKHFDGNKRACRQTGQMRKMLETAGLPASRVGYTQVSHAMPKVLLDTINGFTED